MNRFSPVVDLEETIAELTRPNLVDRRFSGGKFQVNPATAINDSKAAKEDLIVVKVSGKLLLDEREPGELLTKREYLVKCMAVASQLGLNIMLIHGGQEQIDRIIKGDDGLTPAEQELSQLLTVEERVMSQLKNGSVRYTTASLMSAIEELSPNLSRELSRDIRNAGGNSRPFITSALVANRWKRFKDPKTGQPYNDSYFGHIPLNKPIRTVQRRLERITSYLKSPPNGRVSGHIAVRGWVVVSDDRKNYRGEPHSVADANSLYRMPKDRYALNGDGDNIWAATVRLFGSEITRGDGTVLWKKPKRVQAIEIARNGGLRESKRPDANIVDMITSKRDLEKIEIEGGMEGKAENCWDTAMILQAMGIPFDVKVIHPREFLPVILGYEPKIRAEYKAGLGTTFAPGRNGA